jgi:serine/threonine-protein kinase
VTGRSPTTVTAAAAAPPVVLNGRYEVGSLIAEGGMAQVFRGRDRVLDRDVAIKVLRAHYAAAPEFLDRFRREARLAASLAHPNLVNVFDVGRDGERHYIVMELLPGRTLKDLVATGRTGSGQALPLDDAVALVQQVAAGMAFAHRRGLVHRDLKPQNVLLTEDGRAKVADFGLAQTGETAQLTMPGTVWGTVQYISPEQAQGLAADARSDVYALGAMLFELLTGAPPYAGGTPAAIMMRHVYDPVPPLRQANPRQPHGAEWVVQKAMAKDPAERFQSMDEFAQALSDLREAAAAETLLWAARPRTDRRPGSPAPPPGRGAGRAADRRPPSAASGEWEGQTRVVARTRPAATPAGWAAPGTRAPAPARRPVPPRRQRARLPLVVAGALLGFFGLMAVGALLARLVLGNPGAQARPGARPAATATPAPSPTPAPTATPIPVPGVVGDPLAEAQRKLTAAGLTWEVAEDFSRDVAAGSVIAQDPPANARPENGKPVKLTVSRGPQKAPVPSVIGKLFREADEELTKAGFAVERHDEFNIQAAPGIVFGQDPPRDREANVGSKVTVKVSLGREKAVVPAVIARTEADARDLLEKAGFKVEVSHGQYSGVESGVVFAADPPPGAQVDLGATVRLSVRRDPTPVPPSPTAVPAAPTARPAASATPPAPAGPRASPAR